MKIAFSGKGGVGKTTLASLMIHLLAAQGQKILAVDADSNPSLAAALGFPEPEKITPLIQMKALIKERLGGDSQGGLYSLNPEVGDILDKIAVSHEGIKLISMGAIERGGAGCACPQNSFLKSVLGQILSCSDKIIVIDMEAGLEQLGRGTAQDIDQLLIVVDPGSGSLRTGQKICQLADDLGIRNKAIIANRIREEADISFIREKLSICPFLGSVPYSEELLEADRKSDSTVFFKESFQAPMRQIAQQMSLF